MKKLMIAATLVGAFAIPAQADGKVDLKSDTAQYGYSQGFLIGQRFKSKLLADKIDTTSFAQGLSDALTAKSQLTPKQLEEAISKGPVHLRAAKAEQKKLQTTYMAKNKGKDGVITTDSGLQYTVIKSGPTDGKSPTKTDTVVVHYTGTLLNGKKFDSSVDRGSPATFGVGQVIPGWTEVLQLMKPGDKWAVVIPSELAYGKRGAGGLIGPDEVLLFDVELISIK